MPPEGIERNWLNMDEMSNLLAVARGQGTPACTIDEGICAQKIATLARQSAQDGMKKILR
jgi:hypothetical protein